MNLANTSDAQYNAQYASNEVPSPFLPSPFAAPLALPQPSDLYGAKLKVTLDHVKREIGVVREGLEGVMQVRDEVESVRRETGILKQLVETQNELLEKRILDAVSSLIDSKLAPLFESVVQASSTLSATLKSNETSAIVRARAQNARIEEVEASAKRRMEEVERQIGAERIKSRREVTQRMQKLEQRLESVEKEAESKEVAAIETRFKLAELERKMDSLTKQAQTLSVRNANTSESDHSNTSVNLVSTGPSTLSSNSSLSNGTSSLVPHTEVVGNRVSLDAAVQGASTNPLVQTSPTHSDPSPPRRRPRRSLDTPSITPSLQDTMPNPLNDLSSNRASTSLAEPHSSRLISQSAGRAGNSVNRNRPSAASKCSLVGEAPKNEIENVSFFGQAATENRYILAKSTPRTPVMPSKPSEQTESTARRRRLIEQDQSQGTMEIENGGKDGSVAEKSGVGAAGNDDEDDEGEPDTQE